MGQLAEAYIDIVGRDMGLKTAMSKAQGEVNAGTAKMEARLKAFSARMGAVGRTMSLAVTAPIVAGFGFAVKGYMEAEQADARLRASLKQTGSYTDELMQKLTTFADAMMKVTIYDDEATKAAMAYAHNLGIQSDRLDEAAKAAMGLAARFRIDLMSAMKLIGRASMGQTQMLARYGIVLSDTLSPQEKFNKLMEIGVKAFSLASAEAKTVAGRFQQFKNQVGELAEEIGAVLAPAMKKLTEYFSNIVQQLRALTPQTKKFYVELGLAVAVLGPLILVIAKLSAALAFLVAHPIVALLAACAAIGYAVYRVIKAFQDKGKATEREIEANVKLAKSLKELAKSYEEVKAKAAAGTLIEEEREEAIQKNIAAAKRLQDKVIAGEERLGKLQRMRGGVAYKISPTVATDVEREIKEGRSKVEEYRRELRSARGRVLLYTGMPARTPGQVAGAEAATEDATKAEAILFEMRKRNLDEIGQLEAERDRAIAAAPGVKEKGALEQDYADRMLALLEKQGDAEMVKILDLKAKKVAIWEAEAKARRDVLEEQYKAVGWLYHAEAQAARNRYAEEIDDLRKLQAAGENVNDRLLASYMRYTNGIRDIASRQRQEQADKDRETAERKKALDEQSLGIFERLTLAVTGIARGETAVRIKSIEMEFAARRKEIDASMIGRQRELAASALLVEKEAALAGIRQEAIDAEKDKAKAERERQRAMVRWTTPEEKWRSAMVAAVQAAFGEPPEKIREEMDKKKVMTLTAMLKELEQIRVALGGQATRADKGLGYVRGR